MITVKIKEKGLIISGHAGFAAYGKDIVCAACSSVIIACVNDMLVIKEDSVLYQDDNETLTIEIIKEDELVLKIFNNLKELLKGLANDYPKNIKVEE